MAAKPVRHRSRVTGWELARSAGSLEIVDELPWPELMRRFAASRFTFVPNELGLDMPYEFLRQPP
jgi:hypothetical protein